MNNTHTNTETRQVSDFDQVSIRGNTCSAQLIITQGTREMLTIEAPPEYLARLQSKVRNSQLTIRLGGNWLQQLEDALTTCLDRPLILYHLELRELTALDVQCAYNVYSSKIETPDLQVKFNGTGDFKLDWLSAERLEVHHAGTGTLRVSGEVDEQDIVLSGTGSYLASDLESRRACVRLRGTGVARIHASQTLDATLRGVGVLEYSGDPKVNKRISGIGQIRRINSIRAKAS